MIHMTKVIYFIRVAPFRQLVAIFVSDRYNMYETNCGASLLPKNRISMALLFRIVVFQPLRINYKATLWSTWCFQSVRHVQSGRKIAARI